MKKRDIFQKVVIALICIYILYFAYVIINIIYSAEMLEALKGYKETEIQSNALIIGIIIDMVGIITFPFSIYCVHTIGENKREVQKVKNALIKSSIVKEEKNEGAEEVKNIECEECGGKISVNDVICPHCRSIIAMDNADLKEMIDEGKMKEISFCENCGYQLFEEDEDCPNCGSKINLNARD